MVANILISLISLTSVLNTAGMMAGAEAGSRGNYLFSSFRGNGEDGLHLAYSHDGLKWVALNGDNSFLKPRIGDSAINPKGRVSNCIELSYC